jgi:hypothetical protein
MDAHRNEITPILASCYGAENVQIWRQRWRIFFEPRTKLLSTVEYAPNHLGMRCCSGHVDARGQIKQSSE